MGATEAEASSSEMLAPALAEDLAHRMLEAWNAHDTGALLALMTDDVVYQDASWPSEMHGHEDVRAFLESTFRAVPDLTFEFESLATGPNRQIIHYWRVTGTGTGVWDPPGLAPTDRPLRFEGAFFGEVRDDRLSRIRVVYDVATILRQVDVLPRQGSGAEKLIVRMANLRTQLRKKRGG